MPLDWILCCNVSSAVWVGGGVEVGPAGGMSPAPLGIEKVRCEAQHYPCRWHLRRAGGGVRGGRDRDECWDGATRARQVSIRPKAPNSSALPTSGVAPLTVKFSDDSTGSPTNWRWDFGDGSGATGQNPSHVYTVSGTYTVRLVVTSAAGMSTLMKTNDITVNAPQQADWATIVDDQFNTPGVPSHWLLYSGSYAGDPSTCASASQVTVPGDGYLHLKMEYRTSGICGRDWYTGGMQIAKAYGGIDQAVTVRWRIVPSADPGIVRSTRIIPMRWVDDPNYAWYQGEADYCEGSSLSGCYIYLHYGPDYQQILHGYSST